MEAVEKSQKSAEVEKKIESVEMDIREIVEGRCRWSYGTENGREVFYLHALDDRNLRPKLHAFPCDDLLFELLELRGNNKLVETQARERLDREAERLAQEMIRTLESGDVGAVSKLLKKMFR